MATLWHPTYQALKFVSFTTSRRVPTATPSAMPFSSRRHNPTTLSLQRYLPRFLRLTRGPVATGWLASGQVGSMLCGTRQTIGRPGKDKDCHPYTAVSMQYICSQQLTQCRINQVCIYAQCRINKVCMPLSFADDALTDPVPSACQALSQTPLGL